MGRSPKGQGPKPDLLFDLPLDSEASEEESSKAIEQKAVEEPPAETGSDQPALDFPPEGAIEVDPPAPREAPLGARFVAGALDLVALVAVLAVALVTVRLMGVPMSGALWIPLGLFLASFSFLYQVVPLAFWGHTPGMAYSGVVSRDKRDDFLTMRQCVLRWLGWNLTILTAGLAGLVALSGVSLSDLMSGSRLYQRR